MATRFDLSRRLEARRVANDPRVALEAVRGDVGDPLFFLARQWRLGEHRGTDAATPSAVRVTLSEVAITGPTNTPENDPRISPPETVIESEPEQWWTIGRRIRVGMALAPLLATASQTDPSLVIGGLAPPYHRMNGTVLDGLALFRARVELGIDDAVFVEEGVPIVEPADDWQAAELYYEAAFRAGPVTLEVPAHHGGEVDWFSVTASGSSVPDSEANLELNTHPSRVTYPGAVAPRWWQISDRRFDPGALAPHRTHLAQLLMIHVVSSHGDDWFTAPLHTPTGSALTVRSFDVIDSMGLATTARAVEGWSVYRISGLGADALLVWPTAVGALSAPTSLDEVLVGVDEDANLLWAIERRVDGAELATGEPPPVLESGEVLPTGQIAVSRTPRYRYVPSSRIPPHWHPYVLSNHDEQRRFVQARFADLNQRPVGTGPGPRSRVLRDPSASPQEPDHVIEPSAVPRRGLRLDRRYMLGRRTDGLPVLWVQRRSTPLAAAPASSLRFDVLEELPALSDDSS